MTFNIKRWIFPIGILCIWTVFMFINNYFGLYLNNWQIAVAMLLGSFVAGSTSVGGGTVGYPVLVLLFSVSPILARDFSLFVQSIGMTMAMFAIIFSKQEIKWGIILKSLFTGILGLHIGFKIVGLFPPSYLKMTFAVIWASFLIHMLFTRKKNEEETIEPNMKYKNMLIYAFGFLGGIASGLVGSGIDMLIFIVLTQRFRYSYKTALTTSIAVMALLSIYGTTFRIGVDGALGNKELLDMWLVCIPIVSFGAPLGTVVVKKYSDKLLKYILYTVIIAEIVISHIVRKKNANLIAYEFVLLSFFLIILNYLSKSKGVNINKKKGIGFN